MPTRVNSMTASHAGLGEIGCDLVQRSQWLVGKAAEAEGQDEGWADSCIERPSPRPDTRQNSCVGCELAATLDLRLFFTRQSAAGGATGHRPGKISGATTSTAQGWGVAAGLIAAASRRHAIKGDALAFCAAATKKTDVHSIQVCRMPCSQL